MGSLRFIIFISLCESKPSVIRSWNLLAALIFMIAPVRCGCFTAASGLGFVGDPWFTTLLIFTNEHLSRLCTVFLSWMTLKTALGAKSSRCCRAEPAGVSASSSHYCGSASEKLAWMWRNVKKEEGAERDPFRRAWNNCRSAVLLDISSQRQLIFWGHSHPREFNIPPRESRTSTVAVGHLTCCLCLFASV